MKKIFFAVLAAVLALTMTAAGRKTTLPDNYYPATMCVIDLDYSADVVTVQTSTGYIYRFTGCADYYPGDLVALIMDDNGTKGDIADDKIIADKYAGFWLEAPEEGTETPTGGIL